jgi:hypothetical protein
MELKNLEPELLPIDKLPHLRFQVESAERSGKIISHLNIRKKLLQDIIDSKSNSLDTLEQLEMNEKELLLIKTDIELAKTHTDIIKKNEYIKDLRNNLVAVLKEMDENWADVIEKAEDLKETNNEIATWLGKLDMAFFDTNWEYAIDFYLNLKHIIYPPKEEKKEINKLSKV